MVSREQVLVAAQRELNVEPSASMARIAEAAGVGRATLHRHFASREDLLAEIGTRSLDRWESHLVEREVADVAASGDAGRISACLAHLVTDFVTDAEDFGFVWTDDYLCTSPELVARSTALTERENELYAAAQSAGVLRSDVSARWLGHAMNGLLLSARDALREGDVARRGVAELVLSTFLAGSGAR